MSEMIERVADGLADRFKLSISLSAGVSFEESGVTLPGRSIWIEYARAAIEAMREPTEGMVASANALDVISKGVLITPIPQRAWNAMIDAALSEKP